MDFNFVQRFEKLSGITHSVSSEEEGALKVAELCRAKQANRIALAGLSDTMAQLITKKCPDIEVLNEPYPSSDLPQAIDTVDIGITGISFAIAQSGTMVETSTDDVTRLISGLPDTHIGILYAKDIIDRYYDGAALIRDIVNRHDRNLVISFISGPSRTGDIELKLTLGVHGPEEAHAIIIG